jgi:hypothetical protein
MAGPERSIPTPLAPPESDRRTGHVADTMAAAQSAGAHVPVCRFTSAMIEACASSHQ